MSDSLATFQLSGKNEYLVKSISQFLEEEGFKVEKHPSGRSDYRIYVYEIDRNVENISSQILDNLSDNKNFGGKTAMLFVCSSETTSDYLERAVSLIRPQLGDYKHDLRLIVAYDLYSGKTLPLSEFHEWVFDVIRQKKANVSGTKGNRYTPTSLDDLCRLIIKSLFVSNTTGETFTAAGEELTDLEIAYLLKKALEKKGKTLDINLDAETNRQGSLAYELSIQTQALLNWLPKKSLEDELSSIIEKAEEKLASAGVPETSVKLEASSVPRLERLKFDVEKSSILKEISKKITNKSKGKEVIEEGLRSYEKKKISQFIIALLISAFILLSLPVVMTISAIYLSSSETYAAYQEGRGGRIEPARQKLDRALFYKKIGDTGFRSVSTLAQLIIRDEIVRTNNYLLTLGHTQDILANVFDIYTQAEQLYQSILGKQTADQKALLGALKVNLIGLSEKLSQVQLLIGDIELPYGYSEKINKDEVVSQISLLKSQISTSLPLLDLVDKILQNLNLQRYLILVQDQNELRPGGGFLSAYALLTLDQGKIIDIQADSSLIFDRLIEGKIEPPKVLKKLTGQSNWFFHDSNLDPEWSVNARQASWFYQRFRGHTVDGVIGINLNFYKLLLEEIGEIELEDGRKVNADSINVLASNPTNNKGFDLSTSLTKNFKQRLLAGQFPLAILARALLKTVAHDEIQLWFQNSSLESLAEDARVAGRIVPDICHPQLSSYNCSAGTVYLNESNFSINKLNYYLRRQDTYENQISDDGRVRHTLIYDYSYPVPAPTNFGQIYNAFYQFYFPNSAQNLSILLDGQTLAENLLIRTDLGNGLTKVDFSTNQNINQPHRLSLSFDSGSPLNLRASNIPFTLSVLKQPGTMTNSQIIKVNYPNRLLPKVMTLPMKQSGPTSLVFQVSPISRENIGILFKNTTL